MAEALVMYLKVFFVGGIICLLAQILIIRTKLTSARILVLFLMIGAVLGGAGVYGYLAEWAGAGATVPITGFGYAIARGAIEGAKTDGLIGALGGGLMSASVGVSVAIASSYLIALIFKPKTKKE